jgi:hypothetical protein
VLGIFKIGSLNYLLRLALTCDPFVLCLPSSKDYKHEPPASREELFSKCREFQFCKIKKFWSWMLTDGDDSNTVM